MVKKDMTDYIVQEAKSLEVDSVLDVGTGNKGVVGMEWWMKEKNIKKGYACDVWVIKELSPLWTPLKIDALTLLDVLGEKSVDVVQAFGFLEHLTEEDGYKFIEIAEKIAKKMVILSAAICIHSMTSGKTGKCGDDPDYKVKVDGNPYHRYNSKWPWSKFEELNYTSNWQDAKNGESFRLEAIAWKHL
jgi:hypothetical protein